MKSGLHKKVFVAMSGGVDSSVAALILKQQGFDVTGVYIKGWSLTECAVEDSTDARRVAGQLGIPFYVFDFEKEYKKSVVDYMLREYACGQTPNPDVMCNREIKFGLFLKKALLLGADYIATGHYVKMRLPVFLSDTGHRLAPAASRGLRSRAAISALQRTKLAALRELPQETQAAALYIAKDVNKDQSYFLWTLAQNQLKKCLFPIGDYTKPQVRALAKKFGLATAQKPDSQGVCFIGEINVAEFLKERLGKNPGPVKTLDNKVVGRHDGLSFYTIGQRKGIGITGGGLPYYVVAKEAKTNTLRVAEAKDQSLFKNKLQAVKASWISRKPEFPLKCQARIRYRQPLQSCRVEQHPSTRKLTVVFGESQRAITSGQSIVFYKKGEMLGGAVIANVTLDEKGEFCYNL